MSLAAWLRQRRTPLAAFAVQRIVVHVTCAVGFAVDPHLHRADGWRVFAAHPWIDGLVRWDSGWLFSIVRDGYHYVPGRPCNVNFFPVYSLAAAALSAPWHSERVFFAAALVLSAAAQLGALVGLERLGRLVVGGRAARRAVWLLALFPFSLFLDAAYTESLYLCGCIWAFVLARERRWPAAALVAALAMPVRIVGVVLWPALAIEYLSQRQQRRRLLDGEAAWLLLAPLGVVLLLVYFRARFGTALPFVATQAVWGRTGLPAYRAAAAAVASAATPPALRTLLVAYAALLPAALALVVVAARRVAPSLALFSAASVALAYGSGLEGAGRYLAVQFPLFVAGATIIEDATAVAIVGAQLPLLAWCTNQFAHWGSVN